MARIGMLLDSAKVLIVVNSNPAVSALSNSAADWYISARGLTPHKLAFDFGNSLQPVGYRFHNTQRSSPAGGPLFWAEKAANPWVNAITCTTPGPYFGMGLIQACAQYIADNDIRCVLTSLATPTTIHSNVPGEAEATQTSGMSLPFICATAPSAWKNRLLASSAPPWAAPDEGRPSGLFPSSRTEFEWFKNFTPVPPSGQYDPFGKLNGNVSDPRVPGGSVRRREVGVMPACLIERPIPWDVLPCGRLGVPRESGVLAQESLTLFQSAVAAAIAAESVSNFDKPVAISSSPYVSDTWELRAEAAWLAYESGIQILSVFNPTPGYAWPPNTPMTLTASRFGATSQRAFGYLTVGAPGGGGGIEDGTNPGTYWAPDAAPGLPGAWHWHYGSGTLQQSAAMYAQGKGFVAGNWNNFEPFAPNITIGAHIFAGLLRGASFAEAQWMSRASSRIFELVVGDPLYAPYFRSAGRGAAFYSAPYHTSLP